MELEEIKLYMRIDSSEDDILIADMQLAAEEYLANAGITKDYLKNLYKLAVKLLIKHWYDNRDATIDGGVGTVSKKLEYSLSSIMFQLRVGDDSYGI